jgi:hypothetical protein
LTTPSPPRARAGGLLEALEGHHVGDEGVGVDTSTGDEPDGGIPGAGRAHRTDHSRSRIMMSLGRIRGLVVGVVPEDADASARPHRLEGDRERLRASGALHHHVRREAIPDEGR